MIGNVLAGAALAVAAGLGILLYFAWQTRRIAAEAERLVPPIGRFIEVDGHRIHYIENGTGPAILFVHGLGAQLYQFQHTLFDDLAADFHVVALDRPGSGYSVRAARTSGRLPDQARVIRGLIDRLGLHRPLLVGHSLGGLIALATALDHPEAISGLVLISPFTRIEEDVPPAFRPLYIRSPLRRWLLSQTFGVPSALKRAPQTLAFVFGPQEPHPDYPIRGGGWLGLRPSHFHATLSDLVAVERDLRQIEGRYGELKLPIGILFGSADKVVDHRRHGLGFRDVVPHAKIEIVEGIGHMPHYAAREQVAGFIRRMADQARAGAGKPERTGSKHPV